MKLDNIDVNETIKTAKDLLGKEENISPALKAIFEVLLIVVVALLNRLGLDSSNSSKPPSSDPERKKKKKRPKSGRKAGGQAGHAGSQLEPVDNPDVIETINIDKRKLPREEYHEVGYESRQVFDFEIKTVITEYRAQILENSKGQRFVAEFPEHVTRPAQYGATTKATAVYLSQYQLLPYARVEDYFQSHVGFTISAGTLYNFNQKAYLALDAFERFVKSQLQHSTTLHADETGININGKRHWLHTACNAQWTYFYPHQKRGSEAMDDMGIIPNYTGILSHDHWKPYYTYTQCQHALCNAHHLRELTRAFEQDNQQWAKKMHDFLTALNIEVNEAGGVLSIDAAKQRADEYDAILDDADQESPPPVRKPGQRGKLKRSKARNLLERLRQFKSDVLRFMYHKEVEFTNNQGENDIRMTKVQQKISGCFRSMEGALAFCRIRAFLITCRKQGVKPTEALTLLFKGKLPDFVKLE